MEVEHFREKLRALIREAMAAGKTYNEITIQINNVEVEFGRAGGWKEPYNK